jgi:dynactin complex subunit
MEEHSRTNVINTIQELTDRLNISISRLNEICEILKDTSTLSDDEGAELSEEKELITDDISEIECDLGMYYEILHILDMRQYEDERSCSPYEERYDSWDEVFTGGDY